MKLTSLLERLEYEVCQGSDDLEVTELINDSRKVKDCLLYTSPSPRDRSLHRMPSSA